MAARVWDAVVSGQGAAVCAWPPYVLDCRLNTAISRKWLDRRRTVRGSLPTLQATF